MTDEQLSKLINIKFILVQKQIELCDQLAETKLFKHKLKQTSKAYLTELEKASDEIVKLAKGLDEENFVKELDKTHLTIEKLDEALDEIYNEL